MSHFWLNHKSLFMERKTFLKLMGLTTASTVIMPSIPLKAWAKSDDYISKRPLPQNRRFRSKVVDDFIATVKRKIKNPKLAWMFENCYPNTLDTTVYPGDRNGKPDTFVITGDIHAMWLRDSSAQVWPYMRFLKEDPELAKMIKGVINRHAYSINLDPYANAFCESDINFCAAFPGDRPRPENGVFERKWEIDSLCYTIRLAHRYYKETNDDSFMDDDWIKAMETIVEVFIAEQRLDGKSKYEYARETDRTTDTSFNNGQGRPFAPVGAICSAFRPSDDSTIWNFLVPSNLFAVRSLRNLAELLDKTENSAVLSNKAKDLAMTVEAAVMKYGTYEHPEFGKMLCYEFDGLGNQNFMDDANVPSLMSLPFLDIMKADDPLYVNTRKYLLSDKNGWFFRGTAAEGQGSPHTGLNKIWPMGIIMRAMTTINEEEINQCLAYLVATDDDKGFMHESFNKDKPSDFTREWFAWANGLFGELVVNVYENHTSLIRRKRF